jgi:hypothetical protein
VINEAPQSHNDARHFIHTCLDLLVDGETGTWHIYKEGAIMREDDAQRRYFKEKAL